MALPEMVAYLVAEDHCLRELLPSGASEACFLRQDKYYFARANLIAAALIAVAAGLVWPHGNRK
jgi:hypothetical protein